MNTTKLVAKTTRLRTIGTTLSMWNVEASRQGLINDCPSSEESNFDLLDQSLGRDEASSPIELHNDLKARHTRLFEERKTKY